jgi:hypothetical protein
MRKCVEFMNPDDTFQVISYSTSANKLASKPLENNKENLKKSLAYIDKLAGNGGTIMLEGVKAALDFPNDPKRMRIIFFMTDGYIGNEVQILSEIEKNIGNARLFSLGVGSSVNRYLLDTMAEVGRGDVQYVRPNSDTTQVVEKFYERISKPYLTDIEINWNGLKVADIYPKRIPDLFSAQPLFIYGRYTKAGKDTVELKGKIAGKEITIPVNVEFPENNSDNQSLASIWARQKIKDLENRQLKKYSPDVVSQITALALEFKLMSGYTSFVAVEENYKVENGQLQTISVPVQMPESVSYEGVFGNDVDKKVMYNCPATTAGKVCKENDDGYAYIPPVNIKCISIYTKSFKSLKDNMEVSTGFDFTNYLKKSDEHKSCTRVSIYRNGELVKDFYSTGLQDKAGIYKSKNEKNIIINFAGKNPFEKPGEYTLIIEVYDDKGVVTAKGADVVTIE